MFLRFLLSLAAALSFSSYSFAQNCPAVSLQIPANIEVFQRVSFKINLQVADWEITGPQGFLSFSGSEFDSIFTKPGLYNGIVAGADACEQVYRKEFEFYVSPIVTAKSLVINNGDAYTNQLGLYLSLSAENATEMLISETPSCTGQWQTYSETARFSLSQKNQKVTIYAKFRNGSKESGCISDDITHDDIAPTVLISSAPKSWTADNFANIVFSATDSLSGIASQNCQFNGSPLSNCSSPLKLANLTQANNKLQIQVVDRAGNLSQMATADWSIDFTAPTIAFQSTPANPSEDLVQKFSFIATDAETGVAKIECSLDQSAFMACQSPYEIPDLSEGAHSLIVQVTNGVGLVSSASYAWDVEFSQPAVFITQAPSLKTFIQDARFEFTGESVVGIKSFQCRLDQGAISSCVSPTQFNLLAIGKHIFSVRAEDNKGRFSDWATHSWVIEKKPVQAVEELITSPGSNHKADILIVMDNSQSMSQEYNDIRRNFNNFTELLSGLDWQLALTSTDARGSKKWESGKLSLRIDKNTSSADSRLIRALQNIEEGSAFEEGIKSSYLAVTRTENQNFYRKDAALILLIVSDEDERGRGAKLKTENMPENLIATVKKQLGENKVFVAHTVVYQPDDSSCRNAQYKGHTYAKLSNLTGGLRASICGRSYVSQLQDFASAVPGTDLKHILKCVPIDGQVSLNIQPTPPVNVKVAVSGNQLTLLPAPPKGSRIQLNYECTTRLGTVSLF